MDAVPRTSSVVLVWVRPPYTAPVIEGGTGSRTRSISHRVTLGAVVVGEPDLASGPLLSISAARLSA